MRGFHLTNLSLQRIKTSRAKDQSMKYSRKILRIGNFNKLSFFEMAILNFFASFPWKQVKVYWIARMGQNFDQDKCDNTFWPRPNILHPSVLFWVLNEIMTCYRTFLKDTSFTIRYILMYCQNRMCSLLQLLPQFLSNS